MLTKGEVQGVLRQWHADTPTDLFLPAEPRGLLRLIRLGNNEAPYLPDWLLQDALEVLFENRAEKAGLLEESLKAAEANAEDPGSIAVPHMGTYLCGAAATSSSLSPSRIACSSEPLSISSGNFQASKKRAYGSPHEVSWFSNTSLPHAA
ncbi:hypothetical protein CLOP_g18139 [Closterium sp. NIES-67]|nr:hypothetical protein CLOP_g18139 [Closterium sp. NIES-67]